MDSQDSVSTTPGRNWVEVRPAGSSMGNGLFATRDIPRGTRIIAEGPILAVPNLRGGDVSNFCAALYKLPKTKWKPLDQLYHNTSRETLATRAAVREWLRDHGIANSNGEVLKGKKLQDAAKAATKRYAIYATNRVEMERFADSYSGGVFPLSSRINHSCVPNAHNAYNPNIKQLTVHAARRISAGEQVTVSYLDGLCRTREQRESELAAWDFACGCAACADPATDPPRARMFDLDQRLARFSSPHMRMALAGGIGPTLAGWVASWMPTSEKEALADADELADLLKQQGLVGMELCKTYRDCSKYSLRLGDFRKGLAYAYQELDVERCIVGEETEHLRGDLSGARYWLEYLVEVLESAMQQTP